MFFNNNKVDEHGDAVRHPFYKNLIYLFFPGFVIGFLLEVLFFRKKRLKPVFLVGIALLNLLLSFIIVIGVRNIEIIDIKYKILSIYLMINILMSTLFFSIIALIDSYKLKRFPVFKKVEGWTKNFKYSRTPMEEKRLDSLIDSCLRGEEYSREGSPLGVCAWPVKIKDKEVEKDHIVRKYYDEAIRHTIITGASGSGKTVTLRNQIYNDIAVGNPVIIVDCKADVENVELVSKWAKLYGREFYHFATGPREHYNNIYNKSGKAGYDALAFGSVSFKRDVLINMMKFTDVSSVYEETAKSVLGTVNYLLNNVEKDEIPKEVIPWGTGGLSEVAAALKQQNLLALIENFKRNNPLNTLALEERYTLQDAENLYNAMNGKRDRSGLKDQAEKYRMILGSLITSAYGEWLVNRPGEKNINLLEITKDKNAPVVLFSLDDLSESKTSKILGDMITANIKTIIDARNDAGVDTITSFYIDECQTLDFKNLLYITAKARSAKIACTFTLQSLNQIEVEGNDSSYVDAMLENCSNFIVHAGSSEKDGGGATLYSDLVGYVQSKTVTQSGMLRTDWFELDWYNATNRDIQTPDATLPIVSPSEFSDLIIPSPSNGWTSTAYYITKDCSEPSFAGKGTIARKFYSLATKEITDGTSQAFLKEYNKYKNVPRRKRTPTDIPNKRNSTQSQGGLDRPLSDYEKKILEQYRR